MSRTRVDARLEDERLARARAEVERRNAQRADGEPKSTLTALIEEGLELVLAATPKRSKPKAKPARKRQPKAMPDKAPTKPPRQTPGKRQLSRAEQFRLAEEYRQSMARSR